MPGRRSSLGELHLDVAKEHAQWWHPDMTEKIDTQTRKNPGASFIMNGAGPALSAKAAEECNRVVGRELTEGGERLHADLARQAKEQELDAWNQFKFFSPVKKDPQSKDVVDTRWVLTWKEVEGAKTAKSR